MTLCPDRPFLSDLVMRWFSGRVGFSGRVLSRDFLRPPFLHIFIFKLLIVCFFTFKYILIFEGLFAWLIYIIQILNPPGNSAMEKIPPAKGCFRFCKTKNWKCFFVAGEYPRRNTLEKSQKFWRKVYPDPNHGPYFSPYNITPQTDE